MMAALRDYFTAMIILCDKAYSLRSLLLRTDDSQPVYLQIVDQPVENVSNFWCEQSWANFIWNQTSLHQEQLRHILSIHDVKREIVGMVLSNSSQNELFFVWKGSMTLVNWKYNFEIPLVPFEDYPGLFHSGFTEDAEDIFQSNEMWDFLTRLLTKSVRKIHISGHSMGAAMAHLFSLALYEKILLPQRLQCQLIVTVFGTPKFCDQTAADGMIQLFTSDPSLLRSYQVYNIVEEGDPVPVCIDPHLFPDYVTYGGPDNCYYQFPGFSIKAANSLTIWPIPDIIKHSPQLYALSIQNRA